MLFKYRAEGESAANSQAKGPNFEKTLESLLKGTDEAILSIVRESFR